MAGSSTSRRLLWTSRLEPRGVVDLAQLRAFGITDAQVEGMRSRGELRPAFPGVYYVGPVTVRYAREGAAVLACGRNAVASHLSAAYLLELLPYPAHAGRVDVTVPKSRRRIAGIRAHQGILPQYEIRERHGIPVTSPIRTLLDLAGCATDHDLERAVSEAFALRLTNRAGLLRGIVPGRRGAARLRALLDAGPKRVRSAPERDLLRAIRATRLPEPLTNHRIGPWEADLYWPRHQLVVEVDGYAAHSSPTAFERDRRKDADLRRRGLTVQRFSAKQIRDDLDSVVTSMAACTLGR